MKNITLSADDGLIAQARSRAHNEHRTLNAAFREWLQRYTQAESNIEQYHRVMAQLRNVRPGKRLTRDDLNER